MCRVVTRGMEGGGSSYRHEVGWRGVVCQVVTTETDKERHMTLCYLDDMFPRRLAIGRLVGRLVGGWVGGWVCKVGEWVAGRLGGSLGWLGS